MRTYNRISIYLGFFALAAVALLLEKARQRWARTPPRRWAFAGLLAVLLVGGVLDQTTAEMVPRYETLKAEYVSDADSGQRLEETVPPDSFVFELPYGWFPEAPPKTGFADIDLVAVPAHADAALELRQPARPPRRPVGAGDGRAAASATGGQTHREGGGGHRP